MLRNVEIADSECEVDRVDVLERGRQRGKMGDEEDGRYRTDERASSRGAQRGCSRSAALRLPSR
jgi:hypothetical protein